MTAPWVAAFVALTAVVVLQGALVVGLLRRLDSVLDRLERSSGPTSPVDSGLLPGRSVPDFALRGPAGQDVRSRELWANGPAILLLAGSGCAACERLIDELTRQAWGIDQVHLVVAGDRDLGHRGGGDLRLRDDLSALQQIDGSANTALESVVSPHAFLVDREGIVRDRLIPGSVDDLREMAAPFVSKSIQLTAGGTR
ncbi:MAG: TlpA family protein disulfide reductase [Chloroflexota bacterium]